MGNTPVIHPPQALSVLTSLLLIGPLLRTMGVIHNANPSLLFLSCLPPVLCSVSVNGKCQSFLDYISDIWPQSVPGAQKQNLTKLLADCFKMMSLLRLLVQSARLIENACVGSRSFRKLHCVSSLCVCVCVFVCVCFTESVILWVMCCFPPKPLHPTIWLCCSWEAPPQRLWSLEWLSVSIQVRFRSFFSRNSNNVF